jgi:hypothetical protein
MHGKYCKMISLESIRITHVPVELYRLEKLCATCKTLQSLLELPASHHCFHGVNAHMLLELFLEGTEEEYVMCLQGKQNTLEHRKGRGTTWFL